MVSKALARRTAEVLGRISEEAKRKAQQDPEACLLSLLDRIDEEFSEVSAMLYDSIELTTYDKYLDEAKKRIQQEV